MGTDLWARLEPTLVEFVASIVVALLGAVIAWVGAELRRKFSSEKSAAMITSAEKIAAAAVRELERTVVPAAKEALADGNLTQAEGERIKQMAIDKVIAFVGMGLSPDVAASMVEAAVHDLKNHSVAKSL
jgi:hypothetical protein